MYWGVAENRLLETTVSDLLWWLRPIKSLGQQQLFFSITLRCSHLYNPKSKGPCSQGMSAKLHLLRTFPER